MLSTAFDPERLAGIDLILSCGDLPPEYALDEIREIHSVHGEFDMIAKIVLTRDLITSDEETIGHFVHNQVRQLPGVVSTQTLIPG